MKVALSSLRIMDGDAEANLRAMERAAREAKAEEAVLCCFGECALQGFNCLAWDYKADRDTGVCADSPLFGRICRLSREIGIDLLFGFIERDGETLYSSCALIADGSLLHLFRRVSKGWKEFSKTDGHYREGTGVQPFTYRSLRCLIALCGDLWDDTASLFRDLHPDLLFWPVYICYTPEEWASGVGREYAERSAEFSPLTLLINSAADLNGLPDAHGGCACFRGGRIDSCLPVGEEGLLLVDIR